MIARILEGRDGLGLTRLIAIAALAFMVSGCALVDQIAGGADVPGYVELSDTLPAGEAARLDFFNAAAAYSNVQIILEQAVLNPSTPEALRDRIKAADAEMVAALHEYEAIVESAPDDVDAITLRLTAAVTALNRAQLLLIETSGASP